MRVPAKLFWNIIGDFFENFTRDEEKRSIELLWQGMRDLAVDAVSYLNGYKNIKNIFKAEPYSNWGRVPTNLAMVEDPEGHIFIYSQGHVVVAWSRTPPPLNGGYVRINNRDIRYISASFERVSNKGGISRFYLMEKAPDIASPSSDFSDEGRWKNQGFTEISASGISVDGMGWAILSDSFYMDGAYRWSQTWVVRLVDWVVDEDFRSISLNSIGDSGPGFEVRLQSRDNTTKVLTGTRVSTSTIPVVISGGSNTVTRGGGSFTRDGIRVGDKVELIGSHYNQGIYEVEDVTPSTITFSDSEIIHNEDANVSIFKELDVIGEVNSTPEVLIFSITFDRGRIRASIDIDGEVFALDRPFSVSPGRRKHTLDIFNSVGSVSVKPEYMVINEGVIWDIQTEPVNIIARETFTHLYKVDHPVITSGKLHTEPWVFDVEANIIQDGKYIHVDPDEDWLGYLPEYAIIGDCVCRLIDENRYEIVSGGSIGESIQVFSTDVEWIDVGILASPHPLPDKVFISEAKTGEFNLYDRFGKMLKLQREGDSEEYLDVIRGVQAGLLSKPTKRNLERAVSILLGVPYATESGVLTEVGDDYFSINNVRYKSSSFLTKMIPGNRRFVDFLEPLVDMVEVHDFITDYEKIKSISDPWSMWNTFFVRISDSLTVNTKSIDNAIDLLSRIKDKRYDFRIEFYSDDRNLDNENQWSASTMSYGHVNVYEDMVFDDGGAVVMNVKNEEKQSGVPWMFNKGLMTDGGKALGGGLAKFKVKVFKDRLTEPILSRDGVYLDREISPREASKGYTKKTLRFNDSGGARPTEICRVLEFDPSGEDLPEWYIINGNIVYPSN